MFKILLTLLMTSSLHANILDSADFEKKTAWAEKPILSVVPLPQKDEDIPEPKVSARSAVVIDLHSGKILYEKKSDERVPIASLTKLMTGAIITEEETPNTLVQVSAYASEIEGSTIALNAEETLTVKELIKGMMIVSGNDAAMALAEYNAGNEENFVKKMNQKAKKIGLKNTHFSNPVGFDEPENYSTAREIGLLSMFALQNPLIRETATISRETIESEEGIEHEYVTTNKLLEEGSGIEGITIEGLKTGRTPEAGECLVTLAKFKKNKELLTVVLGSQDRFQDTKDLIHWVHQSYTW